MRKQGKKEASSDNNKGIGRIKALPIRDIFKNEARDFTTWMESNIEALSERIEINLTVVQREHAAGDFNVDLLCEDSDGRRVIIENQLETTNHDHLGKLLTYLVNLDAKIAIWVTPVPRPEHQKVIEWLNETTPADISFYLIKAEAVRIGTSAPAALFTILAGPDVQTKKAGIDKEEWAERQLIRFEFWKGLLEKCKKRTDLFSRISPSRQSWINTGAGKGGVYFAFIIRKDAAIIQLFIDHDKETGKKNKAIFDALYKERRKIERQFGGALQWRRSDSTRASFVDKRLPGIGLSSRGKWATIQDKMIDAMIRFDAVFRPRLAKTRV